MIVCKPMFMLVVMAMSSLASRMRDSKNPLKLPKPSKTIVHERSGVPAVNLHMKNQAAPAVGKTTKTVVHQKVPGNGYKPGSPLYNVQEGKADAPASTKKAAEPQNGTREEKLYACVDDELAPIGEASDNRTQAEIWEGVEACMTKYDATPGERFAIQAQATDKIYKHHWVAIYVFGALFFILVLIAAFIYQRQKKDPEPTRSGMAMDRDEFTFGICSCFEVPGISLLTCCCFAIRWADTMRMASMMSFWAGVLLITGLELIDVLTHKYTGGAVMLVAWGIVVYYRQKLRKEFGLESGTLKSCCCDICGYCWIPCCMAVQEARQLEEAYAVGHPIRKVPAGTGYRLGS